MLMDLNDVLMHIGGMTKRKKSKFVTPMIVRTTLVKVGPKKQLILTRTPILTEIG